MTKIAIIAAAALAMTGCNTVAGVGKDLSAVGSTVTKTANSAARAKPSRTASCVPDSRVPSRACPPVRASSVKTAKQTTKASQTKQVSASATPATSKQAAQTTTASTPVKTSTRSKSGWWQ